MPRWLARILTTIRDLSSARQIFFTLKARREWAALELGLDEEDVCDLLEGLEPKDLAGRMVSEVTGEWMYVFKPSLFETPLYLKLILRHECIVISLHEDDDDGHEK
jgi:hypothetical protein